jgi:hypothetical protein
MKFLTWGFWFTVAMTIAVMLVITGQPDTPHIPNECPETMVCFEAYGPPVTPEYILSGSIVLVKFIDQSDMPDGYEAYAEYEVDFANNLSYCLITTSLPEQVLGDSKMDALGHELLHCITGNFHPE